MPEHVRWQDTLEPRLAVAYAGSMRDADGGATPCCIVYMLKRETADEVAGRLNAKRAPSVPFMSLMAQSTLNYERGAEQCALYIANYHVQKPDGLATQRHV